jgi:hypothetical protein
MSNRIEEHPPVCIWVAFPRNPVVADHPTLAACYDGLLPTQAAAANATPIMRPLFFDFHDDAASQNVDDQQMFGPDYLVAPVLQKGVSSRPVYLPPLPTGTVWTNVFTGIETDTSAGGKNITELTPLDTFPLYKRTAKFVYPTPPPPPPPPPPSPPVNPAGGGECAVLNQTDFQCKSLGPQESCDLSQTPVKDFAACCALCIANKGCEFWTFTMINSVPTCFQKHQYANVLHPSLPDMHVSGHVVNRMQ